MMEETKRSTGVPAPSRYIDAFDALRSEMDRILDSYLGVSLPRFPRPAMLAREEAFMAPRVDERENEKEIVIEAELPGIDEKDISVEMQDGRLTIKGEKKIERERTEENYHMMERRFGSFVRSLSLPETIDQEHVAAKFDKGVLTITLPKRPEAVRHTRKIEVSKG